MYGLFCAYKIWSYRHIGQIKFGYVVFIPNYIWFRGFVVCLSYYCRVKIRQCNGPILYQDFLPRQRRGPAALGFFEVTPETRGAS